MLGEAIQKIGGRYLHRRRKATEKKEGNMKIIRHLHATVEFIVNGISLMVDPGAFGIPENLNETDAILVTHDHFDHLDHAAVVRALAQKPEITVYGPAGFAAQAEFPVTPAMLFRQNPEFKASSCHWAPPGRKMWILKHI